jgi:hypothetical protein
MIKQPPPKSTGIFSDIRLFFLERPEIQTRIKFHSEEERMFYSKNILQRVGIGVDMFSVLNIHRIGIETPVSFVFEELLKWNGDSSCWPNHIAKVTLKDDKLDKIKVNLFGWPSDPFKPKKGLASLQLFHLFNMNAIKIQHTPDPYDFDNARFLLYKCTGGYPIGYFLMYTRSSIAERGEKEMSQLFMMVGFNFYGKKNLTKLNIINKTWEAVHNRATTHIMNKFKQLSEYRFEQFIS